MEALVDPLLKALAPVQVALLPIINPLSTAPVFVAAVGGDYALAAPLVRPVAINSRFVVVAAMLLGIGR